MATRDQTAAQLDSATKGFDALFANQLTEAREAFTTEESPFHLLGLGVCAFLEAALGMETGLMAEATRCLTLAESGAKKQRGTAKSSKGSQRFVPGMEWEVLHADAVVMLGLTHALSESYMGYLQCMYALNSAHSKFTKLYKTVYPNGLDNLKTPAASAAPSRAPSVHSVATSSSTSTATTNKSGFFGRWGGGSLTASNAPVVYMADGPVEELIESGTAFGFGLFNLVFSLLPAKVRGVVGFLGFQHDRKLALQALAVAAAKSDVHSIFAGLVLMTYHGVVLLLAGYQADEAHIIKQYKAIVDKIEARYPTGALWILNRAKILRMSNDAEGAIRVLQAGLKPERPHSFAQADMLLAFELAWTLLAERRYQESADMFIRVTELNSWSHATYYFIAAGCYVSIGNTVKAQEMLDVIPSLVESRKISGKDLPTEVFIKKKLAFYKQKQKRRGGEEAQYVTSIKIKIAIFWNNQTRIPAAVAQAHIDEWSALTPAVDATGPTLLPNTSGAPDDLDNADELALRALLLGISHRTLRAFPVSRLFLVDAQRRHAEITNSTWIHGVATFELAVLDLKESEAAERAGTLSTEENAAMWRRALKEAGEKLDLAMSLATSSTDLSSRLDSRINMLRDEIAIKNEMVGITG
ncbi:hypothetical protein PLICRDRAFT_175873 [Plicaturopsis crispa FD-325 SS-3]|nr:hypothetical protein PLICRDRAFT_175873 [Plicaturopsis crispa FD-325 SS-3]